MSTAEPGPPADTASISKRRRLRTSAEFRNVYSRGRRRTSQSFVVFLFPNQRDVSRIGLTTSRKLGRAVERNRIRRRVREMLRLEETRLPRGFDIVVNPRRTVLTRAFDALRAEIAALLGNVQ